MAITQIDGSRQIKAGSITNAQQSFGTPVAAGDVSIKSYVDSVAQGLSVKPSSDVATTAPLSPANTYVNGALGVGATLTAVGVGILTVDDYNTLLNDYILVKDEASGLKNGLYKVTVQGTAGVPYVLTRAVEMDVSADFSGGFVFIEQGTVNAASGWVSSTILPTMGTTPIVFTQFSGAGQITPGTGISKTGNTLSIDTATTVDKTTAQTLTNKTLTSPVINTPTGIVKGDVGLGNVPNLSFSGSNTGDQTLSDATISTTDITTNNFTTAKHGFVPKGTNVGNFLKDDGTWAAPTASTYHRSTVVSGTQDSANKVFSIANAVSAGSEQVFINGQLLMPGGSNDYVISGTTITFQAGFTAPAASDVIRVYGVY